MARPVHQRLQEAVEKQLLDIVKNGRPAFDANGAPVLDDDGRHLRRPASAADLKAAISYLSMVGVTKGNDPGGDSELRRIVAQAQARCVPRPGEQADAGSLEPIKFPSEGSA